MRTIAVVVALAISTIALSSASTPSFATARICTGIARMSRRAIPHTCSAYAASCIRDSRHRADAIQLCQAARAQCLRTGVHVGPYSGRQFAGMERR